MLVRVQFLFHLILTPYLIIVELIVPLYYIAAFPKSNTETDAKELEALPDQILQSEGGFPHYEEYIGKPNPVDASPIERLKEMNAERKKLCVYTPEIQNKQWIHFPVGVKTPDGDESRLLVHFYAFLFFQDWKQDLWMKRFVRDHVRYIDELQCAAARIVSSLRKRVSDRTDGKSNDFDTIHIRRGDFQYKETRVDGSQIVEQLKKVLDDGTTLFIATDERDKSFFKAIIDQYADVVFLDDFKTELEGVNSKFSPFCTLFLSSWCRIGYFWFDVIVVLYSVKIWISQSHHSRLHPSLSLSQNYDFEQTTTANYYGMIDQLVASRGKAFFGCWFSTVSDLNLNTICFVIVLSISYSIFFFAALSSHNTSHAFAVHRIYQSATWVSYRRSQITWIRGRDHPIVLLRYAGSFRSYAKILSNKKAILCQRVSS